MLEKCRQYLEEKGLEKWFRKDNLIILVLGGILLFIIALPTKTSDADSEKLTDGYGGVSAGRQDGSQSAGGQGTGSASGADSFSMENYTAELERKLQEILEDMDGVGKVQVMITLSSSEELVVEKDRPYSRSVTEEYDSEGGSRFIEQEEGQQDTVYVTSGSDSEPYVIKTLTPEVEGVVVVAQGAGTGTVNRSITEIVQALFGLEAHKVKVVKMGKQ